MKQTFRYEGERDSKKKQAKQECVEFILSKNYGTTLSDINLSKILNYNIEDELEYRKYKTIMSAIKKIVLEYGYILKSISGVGYYILKPQQASNHCYKTYIKRARRMVDKSDYVLSKVDKTDLSDIRQEEIKNMMKLNKDLIENMSKVVEESVYYSRKVVYDTLED